MNYTMNLQAIVRQSYETLLQHIGTEQIILLHPKSRYRSMVIARLLAEPPKPIFYYAMGPYDVNLNAFISGFIHDLAEQVPTFGRHLSQFDFEKASPPRLLESFLADVAELSSEPFFLILDEYDASESVNDVQSFWEQVLLRLPENCQVLINSRTMPRLPWIALIAQRKAAIVDENGLALHGLYRTTNGDSLAELTVRCLGPNSIDKNKVPISEWEGHLPRLLFVFGLERPVVTRTEICQAFWPNLDTDQAVNVFHVTKRRLHKALGFDALVHHDGYYQVNPQAIVHYDVMEFVSALVEARHTEGDAAVAAWQKVTDLYQGPFLKGHSDAWILQQRQAYQAGYLEALMALAQIRVKAGRADHALRILIQASSDNADYELLHCEIMKLYAMLGRRSEAASHYQFLLEILRQRGLAPSPTTQQLYQELMA